MMTKQEAAAAVRAAKAQHGLTWAQLAGAVGQPVAWTVRREPDPSGDRVVVTLDGKFLPYQW